MSTIVDTASPSPFGTSSESMQRTRNLPILPPSTTSSESPHGDPMDTASPRSTMGPPINGSPELELGGTSGINGNADTFNSAQSLGAAAVAAAQGPKVVQTAFIHKLYNMLEDRSIQHLISWSNTNESFVMSPSNEFSKVLAQYFKHTNISSFVRQLNMYGFHKVSDVFHTGSPDSALWEFKHGNGNFKKGDLAGLREIKRRASRHALIHRDSFTGHKPNASQPGTPAEPVPDPTEARMLNLEYAFHDVNARLARTEDSFTLMSSRCQALTEGLVRCHQWTHSLSQFLSSIASPEMTLYSEVANMQREIARQLDLIRTLEHPHESLLSGRQPYFSNMSLDGAPASPRQYPFDESRRSSIQLVEPPRLNMTRPLLPPQMATSPRPFGSIGGANASPGFARPPMPQHPPQAHPLSSVTDPLGPNLARRHTSADIRVPGWPLPNANESPFASGSSSLQWPSSPNRTTNASEQHIREQLAQYEMNGPRRQTGLSRQATPPLTADTTPSALSSDSVSWSLGGPKFPRPTFELNSAPPTRRSSMASNVHSLLNPAETVERGEEGEGLIEDRKRKRMQ